MSPGGTVGSASMLGIGDPLALAAARQRQALVLLAVAAGWLLLARAELVGARGRVRQLRRDVIDSDRACQQLREQLAGVASGRFVVTANGVVVDAEQLRDATTGRRHPDAPEPGEPEPEPGLDVPAERDQPGGES